MIITPLTGLPGCPMSGVLRAKGVVASAALVLNLQPHAASRKAPHAPGRICLSVCSPRRRREGPHFAGETGKALRALPASRSLGSDPRVPPVTPSGGHGQCRGRGRITLFCDLVFFFRGLCLARSSPALVLPSASASEVRASLRSTSFGFGLPLEPFVIFPYITNRSVQSQADDQRQSSRGVCRDPQTASALSFLVTRAT